MRLPIGSTDVSASGGTLTLVGRRGEGWHRRAESGMALTEAIEVLHGLSSSHVHAGEAFRLSVPSASPRAGRFAPGEPILWRYGRSVETARVIRDDDRGLVAWIASGSARLESVPSDGRRTRDVPLRERFRVPWTVRESAWSGPGIVRVAPTGMPWSVWFFRAVDGTPTGAYVNLEVPHRRAGGPHAGVFSRDLVLDLWIAADDGGSEDVWLKDADELGAAVEQGRFSVRQAEAVRALADHAAERFVLPGSWPLDEGWERWTPDAAMDVPVALPATAEIRAARSRSGRTSLEG